MQQLAILGGTPAVPEGMIKPWPPISDVDRKLVLDSLESEAHTYGPNCVALEEEFAQWNGNRFGITTNSGTAALHMAVAAVGCGAGDHVLVTAYSWSSSATCIIHHNSLPVFVDIDFDTINMDVSKIEAAITPKTKAIIAVHLHGLALDMDAVLDVARRHNLKVIEDCCQSHGALFRGKKVGTMGDCATFSFNQNKCMCSGEGGMFTTDDEAIAANARAVWSFGETRTPAQSRDYHAYALGWMYRNNDLTAAWGRAQLQNLDRYLEIQRENAAALIEGLQGTPGLIIPTQPEGYLHNWYNFTSRIDMDAIGWTGDPARMRDAIMKAINAEGVPASVWQQYILPRMTVFLAKNAYGSGCPWTCPYTEPIDYDPEAFPVAQKHSDTHFGMTMPLRAPNGPDVARAVAHGIRKVFENAEKLDVEALA
jgi:perosamine synthetase